MASSTVEQAIPQAARDLNPMTPRALHIDLEKVVEGLPAEYKSYVSEFEMITIKNLIEDQYRLLLMLHIVRDELTPKLKNEEQVQ